LLQWGHVFSDMERRVLAEPFMNIITLQWGHVFSDMERADRKILSGNGSMGRVSRTLGFYAGSNLVS